ncbi:MAG: HAMP domain-containing histidine kinase [Prevotella sp.]|nr:HAMP domain-containing histidine kinase [Prevotella sp.]
MKRRPKSFLHRIAVVFVMLLCVSHVFADVEVSKLEGEDKEHFLRFRQLFTEGEPDDFYAFTKEYGEELLQKGYMNLYYKMKNNEGFFALRHNMLLRAIEAERQLEDRVQEDGAEAYYYLATGLMADIYYASRNVKKAEEYFIRAIEQTGDRDPKFTMRCYMSLAEMSCLSNPEKAVEWIDRSIEMGNQQANVEYHSMSIALKAYILFLQGEGEAFNSLYNDYFKLEEMGDPGFNHRYDNIMGVGKLAFEHRYGEAHQKLSGGKVYVDSALVAIRLYVMENNAEAAFNAMERRNAIMDSVNNVVQGANFEQLVSERNLLRTLEEAARSKNQIRQLIYGLVGLCIVFLIIYVMGRRRLVKKIWKQNKELREALSRAEEGDRLKLAFLRSVNHEIRTPLNAVAGFTQVLCSPDYEMSNTEKETMKERVMNSVDEVTAMLGEMLDMASVESQMTDEERCDVYVNEMCRARMKQKQSKCKSGVEMRFLTNVDNLYVIHTSQNRLEHILDNLLDNALKFTDKGHVSVHCQREGREFVISVADTGPGIPPEKAKTVFERFYKADDFQKGIGLGLSIASGLARTMGGKLTLDSGYTEGARFVLTLPV